MEGAMVKAIYLIKIDGRVMYCGFHEEPAKAFSRDLRSGGHKVQLVKRSGIDVEAWLRRNKHVGNIPRKYFP
jgi:hypothetical protein